MSRTESEMRSLRMFELFLKFERIETFSIRMKIENRNPELDREVGLDYDLEGHIKTLQYLLDDETLCETCPYGFMTEAFIDDLRKEEFYTPGELYRIATHFTREGSEVCRNICSFLANFDDNSTYPPEHHRGCPCFVFGIDLATNRADFIIQSFEIWTFIKTQVKDFIDKESPELEEYVEEESPEINSIQDLARAISRLEGESPDNQP